MKLLRARGGAEEEPVASMVSQDQIRIVTERLRAAPGATIVLFGSHAREQAGERSDLDVLVVEPRLESIHAEMVRLTDTLRDLRIPTDILVVSRAMFTEWKDEPGTVIHEAAREGVVLHAAGGACTPPDPEGH